MRTVLNRYWGLAGIVLVGGATVAACGDDDTGAAGSGRPEVVVTTNILGDMVQQVVGDAASVEVIMPLGADPHEFAASTQQAETMVEADLLVVNGAGFEEGLEGVIDQADEAGVEFFSFADHVELLPFAEMPGEEEEHSEEEEEEEHSEDPHIWTDPSRMIAAVEALQDVLTDLDGVDTEGIATRGEAYIAELTALDQTIETSLAAIPPERRVLVTNHEVFGYFADRYGFEVVGVLIPGGTTLAEPSSAEIEALGDVIEAKSVPAIFAETTQSTRLAEALANSVGDVEVVTLYTESLGEEGSGAETYVGLMRTDAQLIADALA